MSFIARRGLSTLIPPKVCLPRRKLHRDAKPSWLGISVSMKMCTDWIIYRSHRLVYVVLLPSNRSERRWSKSRVCWMRVKMEANVVLLNRPSAVLLMLFA
jgi:hypothetical protein